MGPPKWFILSSHPFCSLLSPPNRSSSPLASVFSVVEGPLGKDRTKYCTLLLIAANFSQTTVEVKLRTFFKKPTMSPSKGVWRQLVCICQSLWLDIGKGTLSGILAYVGRQLDDQNEKSYLQRVASVSDINSDQSSHTRGHLAICHKNCTSASFEGATL